MGTKAERRAAREAVAGYHEARLGELIDYVAIAIDRYRAGEIDAYTVDETIHHYRAHAGGSALSATTNDDLKEELIGFSRHPSFDISTSSTHKYICASVLTHVCTSMQIFQRGLA